MEQKIIAVSACLLGENCKYDGKNNYNQKVSEFIKKNNFKAVPICPEVLGGLSIPRIPSEIDGERVINKEGIDVSKEFYLGAEKSWEKIKNYKIEFAILKAKSPSCGRDFVYDGSFSKKIIDGDGIFVKLLKTKDIVIFTEDEIDKIQNFIR